MGWLGFLPFPHGTRSEMNFQLRPYITNTNAEAVKSQKQNDVFPWTQRSLLFSLIHSSWPRVPTLTVPFRELKLENDCPYEFAAWPLHQDYRLNLTLLSFVCQRKSSFSCDKTGQKWFIFFKCGKCDSIYQNSSIFPWITEGEKKRKSLGKYVLQRFVAVKISTFKAQTHEAARSSGIH